MDSLLGVLVWSCGSVLASEGRQRKGREIRGRQLRRDSSNKLGGSKSRTGGARRRRRLNLKAGSRQKEADGKRGRKEKMRMSSGGNTNILEEKESEGMH